MRTCSYPKEIVKIINKKIPIKDFSLRMADGACVSPFTPAGSLLFLTSSGKKHKTDICNSLGMGLSGIFKNIFKSKI
jgi:hypothetical protein